MRFIWGHALVYCFSQVDALWEGLCIYLAHVSLAVLRVGRQGGFSSHIVYVRLLAWLESSHLVVLFYKVFHTLDVCLIWLLRSV